MPIKTINADILKKWIASDEVMLVDVREPAEHSAEKIDGAILVPLGSFNKSKIPNTSDKKLVIMCRTGKRSLNACQKLVAEDKDLEVYNLEGGITAWASAGNEIAKSLKFFLPLDQQVQLTIGLGVFLGSILAYFVNPLFFLLSGFFGAGLIFAGLSGFCGLALVMAKMPWNKNIGPVTNCCVN